VFNLLPNSAELWKHHAILIDQSIKAFKDITANTYHRSYQPLRPPPPQPTKPQYSFDSSKPAPRATTFPGQGQPMVLDRNASSAENLDTLQSSVEVESMLDWKNRKKKR
jgi:hypothetical protein